MAKLKKTRKAKIVGVTMQRNVKAVDIPLIDADLQDTLERAASILEDAVESASAYTQNIERTDWDTLATVLEELVTSAGAALDELSSIRK